MATVAMSLKFRDIEGLEWNDVLYFDGTDMTTLAIAQAQLTKYEPLFEAVSGCPVVEATVTFKLTVDTGQSADAGYSVRSGAYLAFRDSDSVGQGLYIPGILGGKIANDVVNAADTDVLALTNAIKGSGANSELPLSSRGSGSLWANFLGGKGASRKVRG